MNCHSVGLHSFPVSFENNLYRRIFYAAKNHNLWKVDPLEVAIHPHHVDIRITVLDGILHNCLYKKDDNGSAFFSFVWDSVILNGKGGFKAIGEEKLSLVSQTPHKKGQQIIMKACELHTVFISKGKKAVWLVEEYIPTCDYFPINYSNWDLTKWNPEGLYMEVSDDVKNYYIGKYINQ